VIVVIGILAALVVNGLSQPVTIKSRIDSRLLVMANATKLYATKYNNYPDVGRNIPGERIKRDSSMPTPTPMPGLARRIPAASIDYESWDINADGTDELSEHSVFCPVGGLSSACKFPKESWAANFQHKQRLLLLHWGSCRAQGRTGYLQDTGLELSQ